jgi:ketosteroid isomerase-like protein
MHPHENLITQFYQCFQKKDGAGMAACYDPSAEFSDPVFVGLKGAEVGGMWKMLCERATDLELTFSQVQADDHTGKAYWEAHYTFSQTGRKVHNKIHAVFHFKDGKILKHHDSFSLWRWTRMALGTIGVLLGWTPFLRNKLRKQVRINLKKYMEKKS